MRVSRVRSKRRPSWTGLGAPSGARSWSDTSCYPSQRHLVARVAQRPLLLGEFEVVRHHAFHQFVDAHLRLPTEHALGFGRVPLQDLDLGGPEVAWVDGDVLLRVEAETVEHLLDEAAHRVALAGGDDVVVG